MISESQIEEFSRKWQTQEENIAREYVQHLFLSSLYGGMSPEAKLAFKGGTALRILRESPRFSRDLDFTGWSKPFHISGSIQKTVQEASRTGLDVKILDSYRTSGGWFALIETRVHRWPVKIEWNVSLRERPVSNVDISIVKSPLWISYSVKALAVDQMVQEKIEALFRRKKPRDFFDLYFILRARLGIRTVVPNKDKLIEEAKKLDGRLVERELKDFLPRNHWMILKHLPKQLGKELERL